MARRKDIDEGPDERTVEEDIETANLIYMVMLGAILLPIIPSIVAAIMAFINKKGAPDWLITHFDFQIGTVWKGFVIGFVGWFTLGIYLGLLILAGNYAWWVLRVISAMKLLREQKPIPDPQSWHYQI